MQLTKLGIDTSNLGLGITASSLQEMNDAIDGIFGLGPNTLYQVQGGAGVVTLAGKSSVAAWYNQVLGPSNSVLPANQSLLQPLLEQGTVSLVPSEANSYSFNVGGKNYFFSSDALQKYYSAATGGSVQFKYAEAPGGGQTSKIIGLNLIPPTKASALTVNSQNALSQTSSAMGQEWSQFLKTWNPLNLVALGGATMATGALGLETLIGQSATGWQKASDAANQARSSPNPAIKVAAGFATALSAEAAGFVNAFAPLAPGKVKPNVASEVGGLLGTATQVFLGGEALAAVGAPVSGAGLLSSGIKTAGVLNAFNIGLSEVGNLNPTLANLLGTARYTVQTPNGSMVFGSEAEANNYIGKWNAQNPNNQITGKPSFTSSNPLTPESVAANVELGLLLGPAFEGLGYGLGKIPAVSEAFAGNSLGGGLAGKVVQRASLGLMGAGTNAALSFGLSGGNVQATERGAVIGALFGAISPDFAKITPRIETSELSEGASISRLKVGNSTLGAKVTVPTEPELVGEVSEAKVYGPAGAKSFLTLGNPTNAGLEYAYRPSAFREGKLTSDVLATGNFPKTADVQTFLGALAKRVWNFEPSANVSSETLGFEQLEALGTTAGLKAAMGLKNVKVPSPTNFSVGYKGPESLSTAVEAVVGDKYWANKVQAYGSSTLPMFMKSARLGGDIDLSVADNAQAVRITNEIVSRAEASGTEEFVVKGLDDATATKKVLYNGEKVLEVHFPEEVNPSVIPTSSVLGDTRFGVPLRTQEVSGVAVRTPASTMLTKASTSMAVRSGLTVPEYLKETPEGAPGVPTGFQDYLRAFNPRGSNLFGAPPPWRFKDVPDFATVAKYLSDQAGGKNAGYVETFIKTQVWRGILTQEQADTILLGKTEPTPEQFEVWQKTVNRLPTDVSPTSVSSVPVVLQSVSTRLSPFGSFGSLSSIGLNLSPSSLASSVPSTVSELSKESLVSEGGSVSAHEESLAESKSFSPFPSLAGSLGSPFEQSSLVPSPSSLALRTIPSSSRASIPLQTSIPRMSSNTYSLFSPSVPSATRYSSVPTMPSITSSRSFTPSTPSTPSVPSIPSVSSAPSVPSVPSVPSAPSISTTSVPSVPTASIVPSMSSVPPYPPTSWPPDSPPFSPFLSGVSKPTKPQSVSSESTNVGYNVLQHGIRSNILGGVVGSSIFRDAPGTVVQPYGGILPFASDYPSGRVASPAEQALDNTALLPMAPASSTRNSLRGYAAQFGNVGGAGINEGTVQSPYVDLDLATSGPTRGASLRKWRITEYAPEGHQTIFGMVPRGSRFMPGTNPNSKRGKAIGASSVPSSSRGSTTVVRQNVPMGWFLGSSKGKTRGRK